MFEFKCSQAIDAYRFADLKKMEKLNVGGNVGYIFSGAEGMNENVTELNSESANDYSFLKLFPNLTTLSVAGQDFSTLDDIVQFEYLENLDIRDNLLRDISDLSKLKNLKTVNVDNNPLTKDAEQFGLKNVEIVK
ncbi:MAG: leucine-rich repeat domain-containing protein [Eubacteriales bacterium]|nr:leucine-rich repeat domain-containing protein [Eubacteriales bacterium]